MVLGSDWLVSMIMVSVCLPSDALLQHLLSYSGFSYLGRGVSLHGCSSKKTSISALLTNGKAFNCVDHNKLWKILKEMGIPDHLTCLLRNLHAGQEATVTTGHGTTNWFPIGKGVHQGYILLPCLFKLYAEYIMRNAGLEEAQAGIKIAGRNINNLRYADDIMLWQRVKKN